MKQIVEGLKMDYPNQDVFIYTGKVLLKNSIDKQIECTCEINFKWFPQPEI
ncbi:MAG: hypothetical protein RLZZ546_1686, partial [Bacteroidota bacterium]